MPARTQVHPQPSRRNFVLALSLGGLALALYGAIMWRLSMGS